MYVSHSVTEIVIVELDGLQQQQQLKLNNVAFSSGFSFTYCVLSIFIVFIKCVVAFLICWVMGHA